LQSAASDLSLLEAAARDAGELTRALLTKPLDIQSKGAAGPVTNIDFAVDAFLAERLRGARPDYGWLSEETPDDPAARVDKARAFSIDPIDGTGAMIQGSPQFTISLGVVENGRAFAGAIYNPMTDELFLGAPGVGATMNGGAIRASTRSALAGARMIGVKNRFADKRWAVPWPKMEIEQKQSIAYRMALVASGLGDATILFGFKHEWDIAAGAAIVEAAGGRVSDPWGGELQFNQPDPRAPGVVAAGPNLHALLIERLASLPDPRASAPAHQDSAS
jgi:myo-inositol-1(or 4)-monophosphatase